MKTRVAMNTVNIRRYFRDSFTSFNLDVEQNAYSAHYFSVTHTFIR